MPKKKKTNPPTCHMVIGWRTKHAWMFCVTEYILVRGNACAKNAVLLSNNMLVVNQIVLLDPACMCFHRGTY